MLRTNKKTRLFAALTAVVMLICMLPVTGLAANTVTITTATVDSATGVITVAGTISDGTAGVAEEVTILALRQSTEITSADALLTLDQATIVYLDQEKAAADGTFGFEFLPKAEVAGKYVTIFVGGKGVETFNENNIKNITMPANAAGAIEGETEFILDAEAIEFNVNATAADEGWVDIIADNVAVYEDGVVDEAINVAYAEGKLTITGVALEDVYERELTVKIAGETAGFDDVSVDFKVVSPVKVVADALAANISVAYLTEGVEDAANGNAFIALPVVAEDYDTSIVWKFVEAADSEVETTTGITAATGDYDYELARAAEGGNATQYYLKAEITLGTLKAASKLYPISVNALGVVGPSFTAENVAITSVEGGVYGKTGKAVVTITNEQIENPANTIVKVGQTTLLYSPERGKYVGIVDEAAAADIAAAITVETGESPVLYYGNVTDPGVEAPIANGDVSRALGILKGTFTTATDAQLLAADVMGVGTVSNGCVSRILGVLKTTGSRDDFSIIE